MNSEVSFKIDEHSRQLITDNKTDIEVIKTKVGHIEKWMFLFITEFHIGLIAWAIFNFTNSGA